MNLIFDVMMFCAFLHRNRRNHQSLQSPNLIIDSLCYFQQTTPALIIGDFNSHSTQWGYTKNNAAGEGRQKTSSWSMM